MLQVGYSSIEYKLMYPIVTLDGSDYQRVNRTLIFQPNENQKCFEVPILNDELDEGTESFLVDIISVPPSGVVIGDPGRSIISITDDDGEYMYNYMF